MQLVPSLSHVGLLTLALLLACEPESPAAQARCTEGSSLACACPGGQTGAQHCTKEGAYGACECPPEAPQATQAAETPPAEDNVAALPELTVEAGAEAQASEQQAAEAEPVTITPEPGVYEVTISREGQCLSLSGPRKLPATTRKQRWRISVSSPNTLTIDDGDKSRGATLTNGQYVFDRPSEHGRALIRLLFAPDGVHGTGTASAVSHRGKNRRTAEDCSETLTITGSKA
jgi:hypothetical protein